MPQKLDESARRSLFVRHHGISHQRAIRSDLRFHALLMKRNVFLNFSESEIGQSIEFNVENEGQHNVIQPFEIYRTVCVKKDPKLKGNYFFTIW